MKYNRPEHTSG